MQIGQTDRPAMRHSRPHNSGARRQAILHAAERIFADEGLEGARTDAIAAAAGVNKALLYYYFRSKHGLYREVLEGYLADFNRQAMELLSSEGSARAVLERYINLHCDFTGRFGSVLFQFSAGLACGGRYRRLHQGECGTAEGRSVEIRPLRII